MFLLMYFSLQWLLFKACYYYYVRVKEDSRLCGLSHSLSPLLRTGTTMDRRAVNYSGHGLDWWKFV